MLTIKRLIRFFIICVILIIYKKLHKYIDKKDINIKNVTYLMCIMWINILQNPVLY